MTKLKICGLRRDEDIGFVNEFKPDYAGFILSKPFWRHIRLNELSRLTENLHNEIIPVGVFVNESVDTILAFAQYLGVIQLHGDENEEFINSLRNKTSCEIWKAIRPQTTEEINEACKLSADKLLIDSFCEKTIGGTGKVGNWEIIKNADITKPFFLAGGISAENAPKAIDEVKPFGVDVSSSVETDKFKDREKIRNIISAVRDKD